MVHVHTYQFFVNFIVFSNKINFEKMYKKCMGGSKKTSYTISLLYVLNSSIKFNNPSYLVFTQIEFIHKNHLSLFSFFRYGLKLFTSFLEIKLLLRKCTKNVQKMYGWEQKTPYTKAASKKEGPKKISRCTVFIVFYSWQLRIRHSKL